jgi:signal peptidase I
MNPQTPNEPRAFRSAEGWKNIGSTVAILITAPILAVLITIFVFQSYEVYGMSMSTTLDDGDRLIVQKVSKNWARLRGDVFIPERYDIVVFDKPTFLGSTSASVDHLIKRVIGLPGERVVVRDGTVTIYNIDNPDGFNPDSDQEYSTSFTSTPGNADITVGQNEIFVMGDNRGNSLDSRSFGAVNASFLTGTATIRFIPVNKFERF